MFMVALLFSLLARPFGRVAQASMPRPRLLLSLMAGCLAVSGCTMARFGYDFLPTLSTWQIERYLGLDDAQRAIVPRHIDAIERWHRRGQLPGYVVMLREVEARVVSADAPRAGSQPAPIDVLTIATWRRQVSDLWQPFAERLAPGMAELALTLRPEQLDRLRRKMEESGEEYREKYLPERREARERARADRVVKRAEFFLGRLDGAQERELREAAARLPASEQAWYEERQERNRALLALLTRLSRERPALAEAERQAREFLIGMWVPKDPSRRQRIEQSAAASDELSLKMLSAATPAQRNHLLKALRDYARDFQNLAGAPAVAANR